MPVNRRLYRADIYLQVARMARKHRKLSFPRLIIQAFDEFNPDRTNEPDDNMSNVEAIRGWLQAIPIANRHGDIRLYIDSLNRPDLYAIRFCDRLRREWNDEEGHETRQLAIVPYTVKEIHAATKTRPEYSIQVTYHYLQVLRGTYAVRYLDGHLRNGISGLEDRSRIIQNSVNTRSVDQSIRETIRENEAIERGV